MKNTAVFLWTFLSNELLRLHQVVRYLPSDTAQTQCKCEHQRCSADYADTWPLHTRMKFKEKKPAKISSDVQTHWRVCVCVCPYHVCVRDSRHTDVGSEPSRHLEELCHAQENETVLLPFCKEAEETAEGSNRLPRGP